MSGGDDRDWSSYNRNNRTKLGGSGCGAPPGGGSSFIRHEQLDRVPSTHTEHDRWINSNNSQPPPLSSRGGERFISEHSKRDRFNDYQRQQYHTSNSRGGERDFARPDKR